MPGIAYTLGLDAAQGIAGLNAFRGALGGLSGMVGALAPLVGLAGGLGAVGAAAVGFKKSIDEAAKMETLETSFEVMLGSMSRAKEMIADITTFAASTPLEMPGIADAARTLLNFSVEASDVLPILRQLGDISGGDAQKFASLALVFGQVSSAGKMSGQDLLQFINAGFNPLLQISKQTGESMASLRKKMEAGEIGVDQLRSALASATQAGGQFFGMMEKQAGTWTGLMSTLQDGINAVFREFGTPILPELKPALSEGISLTEQLGATARQWGENVATATRMARMAFADDSLGELVGLSLKVGFATAIDYLRESLASTFASAAKNSTAMFEGLSLVFRGVTAQISAAITKGITSSLSGVKVAGFSLIDPADAKLKQSAAATQADAGEAAVAAGLRQIQSLGGAVGQLGGFFKGLTSDVPQAKAQLAEWWAAAQRKMQEEAGARAAAGATAPQITPPAAAATSLATAATKIDPLSDRLSKIGGFIGGSGGAAGERAQLDTARNTGLIARHQAELKDEFREFFRRAQPQGVF